MNFIIGPTFSREFSFEESSITKRLESRMNIFFNSREYGERIKKIYVGVICVSKDFEPFFPIRPFKIYKKDFAVEYEFKINFNEMIKANEAEREKLLANEFQEKTIQIFRLKNLEGFDMEGFEVDLKLFFEIIDR